MRSGCRLRLRRPWFQSSSALANGEDEFPYVSIIGYIQARYLRLLWQRRLNGESEFPYMNTIGDL